MLITFVFPQGMLAKAVEAQRAVREDRAHVYFDHVLTSVAEKLCDGVPFFSIMNGDPDELSIGFCGADIMEAVAKFKEAGVTGLNPVAENTVVMTERFDMDVVEDVLEENVRIF